MPLKEKHLLFCNEYIRTGKPMESYMAAYPEAQKRTASSNAYALLKKPELIAYIDQQTKLINSLRTEAMKEAYEKIAEKDVAGIAELDIMLTKICREGITIDQIIPVYTTTYDPETGKRISRTAEFTNMNRKPNANEKMRAAQLLYRRQGELLPVKKAVGDDPGQTPDETNEAPRFVVLSGGDRIPLHDLFGDNNKTGTE